ncbi:MAG: DNA mismatch repair protein MutS [Firmicutes bacterium]|nr:DNA mismatch repair protein MutS [Bacillota bacterium]
MRRSEVDRSKLSPMMAQYMEIKDMYQDELLFYRLGDFYELFFEDGITASKELELTLTGRVGGLEERVPMCGVPYHSVKGYIEKLVNKGYRVAICEQLEDAKNVKGMVKRGVTDVISKGTIADLELLDSFSASYIASLLTYPDIYVLTILDISTGKLMSISLNKELQKLVNEILHYQIKEIVLKDNVETNLIDLLKTRYNIEVNINNNLYDNVSDSLFTKVSDARVKLGVKHLYYYLINIELKDLSGVQELQLINRNDYLQMDVHAIRNLELVETLRNKERQFSLIWLLDKCKTAMGSRKLKEWIINPIKNIKVLNSRYDKIEKLNEEFILKDELRDLLDQVYDIERLTGKITNGNLNGRDLLQLKKSLGTLPKIKEIIEKLGFDYQIDTFNDLFNLLESAISEDAPVGVKEGGMIKAGYNQNLDELKLIRAGGKDYVAGFEAKVKEETGIKNLKIGFNKVFGYYIEISKGQASEVKENFGWERRQTLANCERFISPELKEKESLILNAEEKIIDLEYELFIDIKDKVKAYILDVRKTADELSEIDVIASFSTITDDYNLVRPKLNNEHVLKIVGGRHPVVEAVSNEEYVDNDCVMDENTSTLLITGPNMSGKSTYMRQVAITIVMAQIGSFVPCKEANLPIIDKIFTRIGASDDLVAGQSTFMVEMMEANNAILNATKDSLIIFDELGRGTATYDGISLAQAILEYVSENIKCKTLFSTHYHEITSLDQKYRSIKNVHVDATMEDDKLVFLHKIKNGSVDKSYGIHVASLANMPDSLIKRAGEILEGYENNAAKTKTNNVQLALDLDPKPIKTEDIFADIDPLNLTPIEALNVLYNLKEKYSQNKKEIGK